jgi:esterase/lipase superfamily enzyme
MSRMMHGYRSAIRTSTVLGLLALGLLLLLGGCGHRLIPTPLLYVDAEIDPFVDVPDSRQSNIVEMVYVTDRKPLDPPSSRKRYGAERSSGIDAGIVRVRIGDPTLTWEGLTAASTTDRRFRGLEMKKLDTEVRVRIPGWPWYTGLPENPDLTEEEYQREAAIQTERFHELLTEQLTVSDRKDVFIFVHGFNNTFEYAAETLAEMWHFLGRPGVAIVYSWPAARAGIWGYDTDRESSEFTVSHLKMVLRSIAACPAVENVHAISHSRGADVLASSLRELHIGYTAQGIDSAKALKLRNIVFAAADLDMEVAAVRIGGEQVWKAAEYMTVYTGAGDTALGIAARAFRSQHRVGQVGPKAITGYQQYTLRMFEDRFSIIHRPHKRGFIGHSYFLDDPAVSSDLILLLRDGRRPGAEHGRPLTRDPSGIWLLEDGYPNHVEEPATP